MPEWASLAAESDLGGDFFELKWTDEKTQEVAVAEYLAGVGTELHFEAKTENLTDGKKVFAYICPLGGRLVRTRYCCASFQKPL